MSWTFLNVFGEPMTAGIAWTMCHGTQPEIVRIPWAICLRHRLRTTEEQKGIAQVRAGPRSTSIVTSARKVKEGRSSPLAHVGRSRTTLLTVLDPVVVPLGGCAMCSGSGTFKMDGASRTRGVESE